MFEKITPEQAGLSSKAVLDTLSKVEKQGYNFHSFMLLKDGKALTETYWAPFTQDRPHRMYSITKSFVAIGIGYLYTHGLVDLDKPFVEYFPEYDKGQWNQNFKKQTVRHMLTMTTAVRPGYWFNDKPEDRLEHYLSSNASRLPGSWFEYDSEGSFALGCLIEKISGKKLVDFLKESFLDEIGFSDNIKILGCPGGHSWGDSAMICTLRELALFAQFVANGGEWNGKQLVDKQYMAEAISSLSRPELANDISREYAYGYQIWKPREDAFGFYGMGGQFAICLPAKNMIFVCNADNQSPSGSSYSDNLFNAVFELFDACADTALEADESAVAELKKYEETRVLRTAIGAETNPIAQKVSGKNFVCNGNAMGWKNFSIDFEAKVLKYENAQGEKELRFDFGKNVFQKFPQKGYSDLVGTKLGANGEHMYDCAVSAAWFAGNHFSVFVQVIDEYFGRLTLSFCFPDENSCGVYMHKVAEDFFREYNGHLTALAE